MLDPDSDIVLRDGLDYVVPHDIVTLLRDEDRCLEFDARGQQDAHEFLRFLLDKVNDCMQATYQQPQSSQHPATSPHPDNNTTVAPILSSHTKQKSHHVQPSETPEQTRVDSGESSNTSTSPAKKRQRCSDVPSSHVPTSSPTTSTKRHTNHSHINTDTKLPQSSQHTSAESEQFSRPKKRCRRNLVPDLFQGKAVTATRCDECECQSERAEQFLDVSLPVEAGKSLAWAWSSQGARENLRGDNKYSCENCSTYTEAQRWWQVAELPEVLTVHLKLFAFDGPYTGAGGKVPVAMPCPVSMRLSEWCSKDCENQDDEYRLTAVIVHEGTGASSGHYYSYIYKAEKEGWYLFDDSYVAAVAEAEMKEQLFTSMRSRRTAYVLFYTHNTCA